MHRLLPLALLLLLAGCSATAAPSHGRLRVVAAENVWGSLAAQLGGARVQVTNLINSPAADPHDYEPTPADARSMAEAQLAIVNGAGYDSWAQKLIDANPVSGRVEITAADLVGAKAGDNPHLWYSPLAVARMVDSIATAYIRLDRKHAAYYDQRRIRFRNGALAGYESLIASIRNRFGGTPVGASESVFTPLARSLGLKLVTPASFLDSVSEGSDPTGTARSTVDSQITGRQIKAWVYNSQNATPDVRRLTAEARANGIPVATVSETLTPSGATFQAWQESQLRSLERALGQGTGR
ncbi:MAG TPA: zinc ABC transporter substrate-binding protein [Thermoleophilaceae bacterium]|nr:zinc ABC transporter substrate-binding protein [Thermoleophilaceae bacterium]